jgi:hypothetical protein
VYSLLVVPGKSCILLPELVTDQSPVLVWRVLSASLSWIPYESWTFHVSQSYSFHSLPLTRPDQSVTSLNLSVIECSLGIICVSIPALRPMVIKMFPNGSRVTRTVSSNAKTSNSQSLPLSTITPYPKTGKIQSQITYDTRSFERLSSFEERQGSS